ncbi:hypothetical protein TrVE_jg10201 [Triparma verrucosa]|uniref:Uncharacterized protein n=1 Tax=Triparma verrucosa TaxID=1606542 RepID=A0A9W7B696_9STRA|nr:hypothetical protein TrVE_jg10201 [Triparma verrucosa]
MRASIFVIYTLTASMLFAVITATVPVATLLSEPEPAFAERTLNTIQTSFTRNVPRMQTGFTYLTSLSPLLTSLSSSPATTSVPTSPDSPDILSITTEIDSQRGTKISAMLGTMSILSTSFSDSVITQTTRELQLATLKTRESLTLMSLDLHRSEYPEALQHYNEVMYYIDVYVGIANEALPMKLKIMGPNGENVRRRDDDVVKREGAF